MTWEQICHRVDCQGRWVALCECVYDNSTGKACEGELVDADDDLAELCQRLKADKQRNCAILFCGRDAEHGDRRAS